MAKRSKLWFEYDEGHRIIRWPPRVHMASYTYDAGNPGRLVVWVGEIQNPNIPVMFLLTNIVWIGDAVNARLTVSYPHNIITDGEKWCPLIKGNNKKFHSYPTGYTGIKLTSGDKLVVTTTIQDYVTCLLGDQNG